MGKKVDNRLKNPAETQDKPVSETSKKEDKDKEADKESEKEVEKVGTSPAGKPSRSHFAPPTVDEVSAYCQERDYNVDPSSFVDFYTANGWKQGRGKPIVDWKAAVRTWERREKPPGLEGVNNYADVV